MVENNGCCSNGTVTILACSGGSNVGQLTNEAAKRLDMEKVGKFFCLAGVGGHVSGMVASVKGSDKVLVLDGCPVACAKQSMDAAGLSEYEYVVVTDLGIEKVHDFDLTECQVQKVMSACRAGLNGSVAVEGSSETELVEAAGSSGSCSGGGCCSCE